MKTAFESPITKSNLPPASKEMWKNLRLFFESSIRFWQAASSEAQGVAGSFSNMSFNISLRDMPSF